MKFLKSSAIALFAIAMYGTFSPAQAVEKVVAEIDIGTQTMRVTIDGIPTYKWEVSTATATFTTCTTGPCETSMGVFHPELFNDRAYSAKFHSPMPHAVYYKRSEGEAIHGATPGEVADLGRPASHGCVRLAPENAKAFFNLTSVLPKTATTIHIFNSKGTTPPARKIRGRGPTIEVRN
jgi:lipoprotein-anchoring transpeptidase ErfK/SrfK